LRNGVRNVFRPVGAGIEHHHAQRVAVLACHQIGYGGFIVGEVEVGLCERRAKPAIVVDFGRTRNNRVPLYGQRLHRAGADGHRLGPKYDGYLEDGPRPSEA
jgi:hypothetical protein